MCCSVCAQVCHSAEACCSLAFDSRRNAWFGMTSAELFACSAGAPAPCSVASSPRYAQLLLKCLAPAVLWGLGTALGEVPPYLLSRAAMAARKANNSVQPTPDAGAAQASGALERTKAWMEGVLKRFGFWGLVALAAWPNS